MDHTELPEKGFTAYLLLGCNLGDRDAQLQAALKRISDHHLTITKKSSVYETAPWGVEAQAYYLNMVIAVRTHLFPFGLLQVLQKIESEMGRTSKGDLAPRYLDIDILFFENWQIRSGQLQIPHPRLHQRKFTLIPMNEIAPNLTHPDLGKSITQLLSECRDEGQVMRRNHQSR